MTEQFQFFKKQITHPIKYRLFMLKNLPSAYFAGVKLVEITEEQATATVPLKWFTKNPFRSIYVAVLSMAAEISTGVLCMGHLFKRKPAVSMLVVSMNGSFYKKSTGVISFVCSAGKEVEEAIERTTATGESETVECNTKGFNEAKELVAEFNFTWSFKARSK